MLRKANYFQCELCYTIVTEQHMMSEILKTLKDDAYIPKLCSEKCCRNFLRVMQSRKEVRKC